ncbi:unnamed protein product [Protopolystoma xenopodis]|uniref:Uncharacterized protein n=1 Tax=Protopolystoma xenopodis TaxID=117903 RepID=A0A448XFJ8_9PLAT|nr:unnamed protein product [Protopolystoma xenopodis]
MVWLPDLGLHLGTTQGFLLHVDWPADDQPIRVRHISLHAPVGEPAFSLIAQWPSGLCDASMATSDRRRLDGRCLVYTLGRGYADLCEVLTPGQDFQCPEKVHSKARITTGSRDFLISLFHDKFV